MLLGLTVATALIDPEFLVVAVQNNYEYWVT